MANSVSIFHSLDLLEKDFDKAYVDLDVLLSECDPDDGYDMFSEAREIMHSMSSCFSQLCHKTQCTAQLNAKLEAQVINSKTELLLAQSNLDAAQVESSTLVRQLHALQLQLYNAANTANGESNTDSESIKDKLDKELETFRKNVHEQSLIEGNFRLLKLKMQVCPNNASPWKMNCMVPD